MAKHAVVRTDRMFGTDNRAGLVSVKYFDGDNAAAIDNGNVLDISAGLLDGEREIYKGAKVTAASKVENVVLVAAPEVMYDERLRNLEDYYNEEDKVVRGYRLHSGDIFSVTAEAIEGTPTKGAKLALAAGTKLKVDTSNTIATVVDVNVTVSRTFYAVQVD